jgi:hypothetical protein
LQAPGQRGKEDFDGIEPGQEFCGSACLRSTAGVVALVRLVGAAGAAIPACTTAGRRRGRSSRQQASGTRALFNRAITLKVLSGRQNHISNMAVIAAYEAGPEESNCRPRRSSVARSHGSNGRALRRREEHHAQQHRSAGTVPPDHDLQSQHRAALQALADTRAQIPSCSDGAPPPLALGTWRRALRETPNAALLLPPHQPVPQQLSQPQHLRLPPPSRIASTMSGAKQASGRSWQTECAYALERDFRLKRV